MITVKITQVLRLWPCAHYQVETSGIVQLTYDPRLAYQIKLRVLPKVQQINGIHEITRSRAWR